MRQINHQELKTTRTISNLEIIRQREQSGKNFNCENRISLKNSMINLFKSDLLNELTQ